VVMTQAEIADKAQSAPGTWVFVNDQLVSTSDVADMNIDAGSRIRLMPGLVGGNAPTFNVEIADKSGHSEVVMTQAEIADKAQSAPGTWVFVNDQLVSTADVADMNIDAGSRIRLMPGLVGGNAPTFNVEIADKSGHSEVVMTQAEIADKAQSAPGTWVFVNDQLVSTADVADMNIDAGSRIRLMPGLVGGNHC
jgi:sulfur carrier protein ThiS